MAHLLLCRVCSRYFKHQESVCPFCETAPLTREAPRALVVPSGASRSRIHAARMAMLASAATFVACTDSSSEATGNKDNVQTVADDGSDGGVSGTVSSESNSDGDDSTQTSDDGADDVGSDSDTTRDESSDDTGSGNDDSATDDAQTDDVSSDTDVTSDDATTDDSETIDDVNLLGGKACPGHEEQDPSLTTCRTDAECMPGMVCSPERVLDYGSAAPPDPCRFQPPTECDPASCDGQCQMVSECQNVCVPNCSEANCFGVSQCVDNQCVAKPCDAEGAQACSAGYVCTPGAAGADAACVVIPCDEDGATACSEGFRCAPGESAADYMGCVRLTCEEDGGTACAATLACDPSAANADYMGCVQLSCAEAGGNACPEGQRCNPESTFAQLSGPYLGCAPLRCDEAGGPACGADLHCDPDSADSYNGCVVTSCAEGWSCDLWRDCNVGGPTADQHGCAQRACTVDTDCECGFCFNEYCGPVEPICRVPEIVATPYGCVWPDDEFV